METAIEDSFLDQQHPLGIYRGVVLICEFEEACSKLYSQGEIGEFLPLYGSQKVVAVGVAHAILEDDYMIAAYQEHG
jgi:pyruvate dehydrogenase E1 component subunit alpha